MFWFFQFIFLQTSYDYTGPTLAIFNFQNYSDFDISFVWAFTFTLATTSKSLYFSRNYLLQTLEKPHQGSPFSSDMLEYWDLVRCPF